MKVPSPNASNPIVRIVLAVSIAWSLAAGGAVAPVAALAEVSQSAIVTAPLSVAPAAPSAEASHSALAPSEVPPQVVPAPVVPPAAPAVAKKLTVPQIIAAVGYKAHLSKAEVEALLWMAKRESNYHPTSESRSECHGLFQLSKGMAHGHPWKDPIWNTKRAIKYMKGRYGGVLKAKAFWGRHHWY